eukprot:CAMPEP_0170066908 /NCGR_PEP_ID=MMETSP0019_2-20121128/6459_1 /TAXON_ID=98059 /ORGANISM="Dinobryon sp., Strain UTEXLB2267" /LENGTH=277 /DNA_ID=CAMNT_0010274175 /DNA_START=269 /DNA_END=1103 /DNA_ORIENTATION=+
MIIFILIPLFVVLTLLNSVSTFLVQYTSGSHSWSVPLGVSKIYVQLTGGSGGADATYNGGFGEIVTSLISVTPGQTLYLVVGGEGGKPPVGSGGFNGGGGNGGNGAGGGGDDIRTALSDTSTRIVVAAGGGGSYGTGTGGNGGYPSGATPSSTGATNYNGCTTWTYPTGGTQTAGGSFGQCILARGTFPATAGTYWAGGDSAGDGGGGGGGYYGGGGGRTMAGAGGSSYCNPTYCSSTAYSVATTYGNGSIQISYAPTATPTFSPTLHRNPDSFTDL